MAASTGRSRSPESAVQSLKPVATAASWRRDAAPGASRPEPASAPLRFERRRPFAPVRQRRAEFAESLTEGVLGQSSRIRSDAPQRRPIEALRQAVSAALAAAGHASAAQLLGAAAWTQDGSSLRIEVPGMGKKMLSLTVNAAAEKIIRQELQRLGAPARFLVVPGEGAAPARRAQSPRRSPAASKKLHWRIPWCSAPGNLQGRGSQRGRPSRQIARRTRRSGSTQFSSGGKRAMINPLKMAEMLSQANQMQEEVQRKLGQTVWKARAAAARHRHHERQEAASQDSHRSLRGDRPQRRPAPTWRCSKTWSWPPSTKRDARPTRRSSPACKGMLGGLKLPGFG